MIETEHCLECGKVLLEGQETFCCQDHRTEYIKIRESHKRMEERGPSMSFEPPVKIECLACGALFQKDNEYDSDYCTPGCDPRFPEYKSDGICYTCGKRFKPKGAPGTAMWCKPSHRKVLRRPLHENDEPE